MVTRALGANIFHAFGDFHHDGDYLLVNVTRQQIENSPAIESHKPVSRQYEEEYNRYYRVRSYWVGRELWGVSGFPSPYLMPSKQASRSSDLHSGGDPHLRSTQALAGYQIQRGYHIQTSEGSIGHVTDFVMDDKSWAICHLVVETRHWFSGKEIVISPKDIDRISYEESKVL